VEHADGTAPTDAEPQAWAQRPACRALLRGLLATLGVLVIVLLWSWLLGRVALERYPDPLADPAKESGYVWIAYRLQWVGACIAVFVGGRIWPRWGVVPALMLAGAAAASLWWGAGGQALIGTKEGAYCIPMGDRWSAVPLIVVPAAVALWASRAQCRRQRSAPGA